MHRSGEHVIGLDGLIRRSFERAFETDLQTTSRVSRFDLEDMLANPEVRPSEAPEASAAAPSSEGVSVGTLPPPAIEIDRTKEEERDP